MEELCVKQKVQADRRKLKPRTCKAAGCGLKFHAVSSMVKWCSPACGAKLALAKLAKQRARKEQDERKQTRAKLQDLKPLSYWRDRAQRAFNAWVRYRDAGLPCVSCGRHHAGKVNAGHYLSRGARPELAFEPLNVWLQCEPCNTSKGGNVALYRVELVRRIGTEKVEWLEGPHEPLRYRREDFEAIEAEYTAKVKAMKKEAT